jgi:hypothetical protein
VSNRDYHNPVPNTVTSIPLADAHPVSADASIGELVRDATAQVSNLVRAEVELAKAEITRDVKKGLTGSVFFILALVVLLYSTFFMFFFLAELLDTWVWRWAARSCARGWPTTQAARSACASPVGPRRAPGSTASGWRVADSWWTTISARAGA